MKRICIGLVGDFDKKMYTHLAINDSLEHCRTYIDVQLDAPWISTTAIKELNGIQDKFHGFWIVPGSPYLDDSAVYETIRWARENNFPLLGSCGGFQYMVVEYARNVLGFLNASHAESEPEGTHQIITKLSCSLKGRQEDVLISDRQSWLYKTLNKEKIMGNFFCSYGVSKIDQPLVDQFPFSFTAFSPEGEARALELKGHRFFNGTLFQPSLDSAPENPNALILDFIRRCAHQT